MYYKTENDPKIGKSDFAISFGTVVCPILRDSNGTI